MLTVSPRTRSGIFGESTNDEAYGVLPGEDRLVRDVMTQEVSVIPASMTAQEAIQAIRNRNVSVLVVCLETEPAFAVTEYDLALNVLPGNYGDAVTLREQIRNRTVIRCREDVILADAISAMLNHRLRYIPVINEKNDLVGVLSLVDAVGAIAPDAAAIWQTKIRQLWSEAPDFKYSTHP